MPEIVLTINVVSGQESSVYDALNATLRELVIDGAVNDNNDEGWKFDA